MRGVSPCACTNASRSTSLATERLATLAPAALGLHREALTRYRVGEGGKADGELTVQDEAKRMEQKLSEAGEGVGSRMLEVLAHREKSNRREIRLQRILKFQLSTNHQIDWLEVSIHAEESALFDPQ